MGEIVTLRVEGMACGACERRLQTVIGRLDGVSEVDADHAGRVHPALQRRARAPS